MTSADDARLVADLAYASIAAKDRTATVLPFERPKSRRRTRRPIAQWSQDELDRFIVQVRSGWIQL